MQLLIILIIAGIIGYFLSRSRFGAEIDQATSQIGETSESLLDRSKKWLGERFGRGRAEENFVTWATGTGSAYFPQEFKDWMEGLTPEEAERFTHALALYAEGLDFDLDELVSGEMQNKPALMQVFVEAVVVYSHEYRKAREAQKEASQVDEDNSAEKKAAEATSVDGKAVAEKQPSRRKGTIEDSPQATSAA
ncbi:MAG: hypothetical protein ACWGO1_08140 [Anaerolineales bacterium]